MADRNKEHATATELLVDYVVYAVMFAGVCWFIYNLSDEIIVIWRQIRIVELTIWDNLFSLIGIGYFEHYLQWLLTTPARNINMATVGHFESSLNSFMRFPYAGLLSVFAWRLYQNKKSVREVLNVQTMIEAFARESEALETLAYDNPLHHSKQFNWDERDDFTNRHAQALSPQRYMSACPPPNASDFELQKHKDALAEGHESPYRAIAFFNRYESTVDFSYPLARQSLERQLTNAPVYNSYYLEEDDVPRLFDANGDPIELEYEQVGKETRIVGGFSTSGLINNGRDFNGLPADLRYCFDGVERDVFDFICSRYKHPSVALEEFVLHLTRRHAYRRTLLVELLRTVRINNTIASTEFYLVCRKDRILYMSLYSASEEKPYYEAMGVMAHWMMEKLAGSKVVKPYVESAVRSLEKDAIRIASKAAPINNLIEELSQQMLNDPDLKESRAFDFMDESAADLISQINKREERV